MIMTATMCMAIAVYKESRSTPVHDQILVAQVINNRAVQQDKNACQIVFAKNQFSWTKQYKPKYKFANSDAMLRYYGITDGDSWITALGVSSMAKLPTSNAIYFHDNSIKKFSFNAGKPTIKTTNFTFYKG